MYPPIFSTVSQYGPVTAILGSSPVRVFLFGEASYPDVQYPYAVYRVISGRPENSLADIPDIDLWTVQVDVYARSAREAWAAAEALRDAIEPVAYVNTWRGGVRDPATRSYNYSFTVDWWTPREEVDSTWPPDSTTD